MSRLYDSLKWRLARARALDRDANRCTVARLLGGDCSAAPHSVHHVRPVADGGDLYDLDNLATVCAAHHPAWEALRRSLLRAAMREPERRRCHHAHRSEEARRLCEARMARAAA